MRKVALVLIVMGLSLAVQAHDEGHGPKVTDTGKFGGLISAVVLKQDANLGAKAALVHKAELVRSSDGTVRVYMYDAKMMPLDMKTFSGKATATVWSKVKGKWKSVTFDLEPKATLFEGKMTKPEAKPYNLDIVLKQGDKELLTAFDNLD